jgi:ATP-dependent Zn protease
MKRLTKAEREHRQLLATAYHEAGHAVVVWWVCRRAVRIVSVEPDEGSLGRVLRPGYSKNFRPDINSDTKTQR